MHKRKIEFLLISFFFGCFIILTPMSQIFSQDQNEVAQSSWFSSTLALAWVSWISGLLTLGGAGASVVAAARAKKSEDAALEAKQQTLKLSETFSGLINTWKLGNAIKEIDRIKVANENAQSNGVHYLYGILCDNIVEYKTRCKYLTADDKTFIQEFITYARQLESIFSKFDSVEMAALNVQKTNERLSSYKDKFNELTQNIEKKILEEGNA